MEKWKSVYVVFEFSPNGGVQIDESPLKAVFDNLEAAVEYAKGLAPEADYDDSALPGSFTVFAQPDLYVMVEHCFVGNKATDKFPYVA